MGKAISFHFNKMVNGIKLIIAYLQSKLDTLYGKKQSNINQLTSKRVVPLLGWRQDNSNDVTLVTGKAEVLYFKQSEKIKVKY